MATAKSRSANDELREGAREGSKREISKDWGNVGEHHIRPLDPAHGDYLDGLDGVLPAPKSSELDCAY